MAVIHDCDACLQIAIYGFNFDYDFELRISNNVAFINYDSLHFNAILQSTWQIQLKQTDVLCK